MIWKIIQFLFITLLCTIFVLLLGYILNFINFIDGYQWKLFGLFSIITGILFLFSYIFQNKCALFKLMIWLTEKVLVPNNKDMAMVYFLFFIIMGIAIIINESSP